MEPGKINVLRSSLLPHVSIFLFCSRLGLPMPPHIQVMREPVEQRISLYQYFMDTNRMNQSEWNLVRMICVAFDSLFTSF